MKLTTVLLLAAMLQASAKSDAQTVTYAAESVSLEKVFVIIKQQTGYVFFYREEDLAGLPTVSVSFRKTPLAMALQEALRGQPLQYNIQGKTIFITSVGANKNKNTTQEETIPEELSREITGVVRDEKREPLEGVSVTVNGTQMGTTTNADGRFQLSLPSDNVELVFSFVGYATQTVKAGSRIVFDIVLEKAISDLSDVVVVGYGTQKKRDLTGAVTQIDMTKHETQSITNLSSALMGNVAGIEAVQSTKASGGASLEIRGQNSITASTTPLFSVDGAIYYGDISMINPSDIQTITVLKGASAAAIYGSSAANGVILITTKKGITGPPVLSFSVTTGMAEASHNFKPFGPTGYLTTREDVLKGENPLAPPSYYHNPFDLPSNVTIDEWRNYSNNPNANDSIEWVGRLGLNQIEIENYLAGKTINWYDQAIRKGLRQEYNLSYSGATKNVNYYISTNYTKNNGIWVGDQYEAIRGRLKLDTKITSFFKIGINAQFSNTNNSSVPVNIGGQQESEDGIYSLSPYGAMFNDDGTLKLYPQNDVIYQNPFIDNYYQKRSYITNMVFSTLYGELALPFGFNYKISLQNKLLYTNNYDFWPSNTYVGGNTHIGGYGSRLDSHESQWRLENIIHWDKTFGAHDFAFTFLYNTEEIKSFSSTQSNENFLPTETMSWHALQYGTNPQLSNNDAKETSDALMLRLNYSYRGKYLLTASWRRDGYSAFGQLNPYADFPSVAMGWRISEEPFFNVNWINQLKIRGEWGINGNRNIGTYAALSRLLINNYYDGSQVVVGLNNPSMDNSSLKWERTAAWNAGIDLGILNNRLNITADAYLGTTEDLLLSRRLPVISGYSTITTNLGKLANRGIELTLNSINIKHPNFLWESNINFSLNRNKIVHLWGDYLVDTVNGKTVKTEVPDYTNEFFPGQSIDRIWDYDIIGIWQEHEKDEAIKYGQFPGDYKVKDVNGDGKISELKDKMFLGWTTPRYRIGVRNDFNIWKRLEVSIFLRADLGSEAKQPLFNHTMSVTYARQNLADIPYWTPENQSDKYPRLNVNYRAYEGGIYKYLPTSFFRIQNASIAYNFSEEKLRQLKLKHLKIFISAQNLVTLTKWIGWDPESLNSPMSRIYSIGISTSL